MTNPIKNWFFKFTSENFDFEITARKLIVHAREIQYEFKILNNKTSDYENRFYKGFKLFDPKYLPTFDDDLLVLLEMQKFAGDFINILKDSEKHNK